MVRQAAATTAWPRALRQRLRALPRERRDSLFLLILVAAVLLPQLTTLPWWASTLALGLLLWRAWLAWQARPLPGPWWLAGLLLCVVTATLLTQPNTFGREAGSTLLALLLALKTLELRTRRDTLVVCFLGFFVLLTNFFVSQSLLIALASALGLLGLLTALVNAHLPVGKPPLRLAAGIALRLLLLGLPLMAALFILFPRLGPLWGLPSAATQGRSGLGNSMQVGTMASLALDDSIAFRVQFDENARPPPSQLYFRGPVLGHFDGREWRASKPDEAEPPPPPAQLHVSGHAVSYQVTLEPSGQTWLLALDATPNAPELPPLSRHKPRMDAALQWQTSSPLTERLRYQARSYPQFRHGPQQRVPALHSFTALPAGFNPRTLELAAELRRDPALPSNAQLVEAVLARLRNGNYSYTLAPGVYGPHSADEFWFDRQEGFCEHIASAFVVLVRALGIPARIVTGYQGGERNPVDGVWALRQSDAHAWTEVWLANQGWVRIDPTAAVAPARIGSAARLQAPRSAAANAWASLVSPGLSAQLRARWEALNHRWNQWVLNYNPSQQRELLQKLGLDRTSPTDLLQLLAALLASAALALAAWARWGMRSRPDPWLQLLAQATARLQQAGLRGLAQPPATLGQPTARALAQQAKQQFGNTANAACNWLLRLEALRYARGSENTAHVSQQLNSLRREFHSPSWPPKS